VKKVNKAWAKLNQKQRNFLRREALRLGLSVKDYITRARRYESDRSNVKETT
jgi:hypothetical protein